MSDGNVYIIVVWNNGHSEQFILDPEDMPGDKWRWKVDLHRQELIIRLRPGVRHEIPLCNIRYWTVDTSERVQQRRTTSHHAVSPRRFTSFADRSADNDDGILRNKFGADCPARDCSCTCEHYHHQAKDGTFDGPWVIRHNWDCADYRRLADRR